jgi:hypothetical protein
MNAVDPTNLQIILAGFDLRGPALVYAGAAVRQKKIQRSPASTFDREVIPRYRQKY